MLQQIIIIIWVAAQAVLLNRLLKALNFEKRLFIGEFGIISSYKVKKSKKGGKNSVLSSSPYVKYVNYIYKFLE